MAKILAPNKQYNGISAGVAFTNGTGESDNPVLLDWFRSKGYEVEESEWSMEYHTDKMDEKSTEDEPPTIPEAASDDEDEEQEDNQEAKLEELNAEELTDYAKEHGIDIGRATSKDGILAKIKEA